MQTLVLNISDIQQHISHVQLTVSVIWEPSDIAGVPLIDHAWIQVWCLVSAVLMFLHFIGWFICENKADWIKHGIIVLTRRVKDVANTQWRNFAGLENCFEVAFQVFVNLQSCFFFPKWTWNNILSTRMEEKQAKFMAKKYCFSYLNFN